MSVLEHAIQLALTAHAGQLDKQGLPSILHSLQVMIAAIEKYKADPLKEYTLEEIIIAAILHDAVEDSDVTLDTIEQKFGVRVRRLVDGVSRRKSETYAEFIVRASHDPGTCFLKSTDIEVNLGRIDTLPLEEQSIRHRYDKALKVLRKMRGTL